MELISTPSDARELLGEYLAAENEETAQEILGKLMSIHATPVIRRAIAQRLGYGSETEDVYGYAVVKLVTQLKDQRRLQDERSIDDFSAYVAVAAYNACHDHLRRKFPERHKLSDRLRHTLTRKPEFAVWEDSGGRWLCGKREWINQSVIALVHPQELSRRAIQTAAGDAHNLKETSLVEHVFQAVHGPLRFDDLVDVIAEIRGIRDEPLTEIDERASSDATPIDEKLSLREFAVTLWAEIRMLPVRQRVALLLSFRDPQGSSATALLVSSGVAGIREIAATVEMPVIEFAGMWNRLPFDDAEIAARLGVTRQQVINLRKSARERLARRMKNNETPVT